MNTLILTDVFSNFSSLVQFSGDAASSVKLDAILKVARKAFTDCIEGARSMDFLGIKDGYKVYFFNREFIILADMNDYLLGSGASKRVEKVYIVARNTDFVYRGAFVHILDELVEYIRECDLEVRRFVNEHIKKIRHPNLLNIKSELLYGEMKLPFAFTSMACSTLNKCDILRNVSRHRRILLAKDLMSGLKELHANGLVHSDIKPDNCFVFKDHNVVAPHERYRATLADLDDAIPKGTVTVGNVQYLHPSENDLFNIPRQPEHEVYSMGRVILETLLPEDRVCREFIEKMMNDDKVLRPTALEAYEYFKEQAIMNLTFPVWGGVDKRKKQKREWVKTANCFVKVLGDVASIKDFEKKTEYIDDEKVSYVYLSNVKINGKIKSLYGRISADWNISIKNIHIFKVSDSGRCVPFSADELETEVFKITQKREVRFRQKILVKIYPPEETLVHVEQKKMQQFIKNLMIDAPILTKDDFSVLINKVYMSPALSMDYKNVIFKICIMYAIFDPLQMQHYFGSITDQAEQTKLLLLIDKINEEIESKEMRAQIFELALPFIATLAEPKDRIHFIDIIMQLKRTEFSTEQAIEWIQSAIEENEFSVVFPSL